MLFAEAIFVVCRGSVRCLQRFCMLFAEVLHVVCGGSVCWL